MAYLATSPVRFPDFERSRNYFKTGLGGPPAVSRPSEEYSSPISPTAQQPTLSSGPGMGGGGIPSRAPQQPEAPQAQPQQQAPQAQAPAPQIQSPAPFTGQQQGQQYQAPTLGYGDYQGGGVQSALFNPVQQAAGQGQADVQQFAEMFRAEAGPSRTYEGIGAESTLGTAVEGGAMNPARELVGAQYRGPAGLDPNAVGNLQFLQGQLEQRQKSLGTGAGLASTIGQTVGTLTPGEARFEAQNLFTPEYRQALTAAMAPVGAFGEQLGAETASAQQFAGQRGAEEAEIARRAAEYLTGRRSGITADLEAQIAAGQQQQIGSGQAFQDILQQDDPAAVVEALRRAQEGGFVGADTNVGGFWSEAQQARAGAPGARQGILDKEEYASIKDIPVGEIGVDKKGRQTYLVGGKDYRQAMTKEQAVAFKKRQGELEEGLSSQRGVPFPGGRTSGEYFGDPNLAQTVDPLYFGQGFQLPNAQDYLSYDPGIRPSRGNISTEDQRSQYNRINDLLGDLDRIESEETPFKAAMIAANVNGYLEEEEAALQAQKGSLDQQGKEWFNMVKKMRGKYRKAEREKKWAKVGSVIGGILGAGIGGVAGGPSGGVVGYGVGSQVGGSAGKSLA